MGTDDRSSRLTDGTTSHDGGAADEASRAWYIATRDQREGPYSRDEVADRLARGEISGESLVWAEGQEQWLPLRETRLSDLLTAPSDGPPPLPTESVSDKFAWMLAGAPLVIGFVGVVLSPTGLDRSANVELVVGLTLNSLLAFLDWRHVRNAGRDFQGGMLALGLIIVPVYLGVRSHRLGRRQLPLAAWVVAFALSFSPLFADVATNVAGNEIDSGHVEQEIGNWFRDEFGASGVNVDCPDGVPLKRGETFRCLASVPGEPGSTVVEVQVQNAQGDIIWQIQ